MGAEWSLGSNMLDGRRGVLGLAMLLEIFIYGATQLIAEANGKKIADIYWNTTNPIFYFDNRYHIFNVRLMDRVDIICPKYKLGYPDDRIEYSLIYLVDRRSYESCTINTTGAKLVGVCMKPHTAQLITITFREFTPSLTGLEFRPNRTYYVISTSNGSRSGLKNERDGLCRNYNMRLQFVVKPRCRPKSEKVDPGSVLGYEPPFHVDEDSEEFDDCDDNAGVSEKPPSWSVDVRPPSFPWPHSRSGQGRLAGASSATLTRGSHFRGVLWSAVFLVVFRWWIIS